MNSISSPIASDLDVDVWDDLIGFAADYPQGAPDCRVMSGNEEARWA
jgi:hypothetical protein